MTTTSKVTTREERALQIAQTKRIRREGSVWLVPSQSRTANYVVETPEQAAATCSCPDFEERNLPCKHIMAVEFVRHTRTVSTSDGTTTTETTETMRVTYRQNWSAYNAAQTREKELFGKLLRELCNGITQPPQTRGRPRALLGDVVFAAAAKVYSTVSGRRAATDIRECEAKGQLSRAVHYNTISEYLETETLTPLLKSLVEVSARPLRTIETSFAVDSSGISTKTYTRWFDAKYGRERKACTWFKVHVMTGVKTHVITSVEITDADTGDAPMFAPVFTATARNFNVAEVSADKAYSAHATLAMVCEAGAVPYVPFKTGAVGTSGDEVWDRLFHFFSFNRAAFLARYHQRSNVETTFHMLKSKFGAFVRAKTRTAQINEILLKVLCHNIVVLVQAIHELNLEPTFWRESPEEAGE